MCSNNSPTNQKHPGGGKQFLLSCCWWLRGLGFWYCWGWFLGRIWCVFVRDLYWEWIQWIAASMNSSDLFFSLYLVRECLLFLWDQGVCGSFRRTETSPNSPHSNSVGVEVSEEDMTFLRKVKVFSRRFLIGMTVRMSLHRVAEVRGRFIH